MTGKRELIDTGNDKRYVRRDEKGRFDEVVDVGRSSAPRPSTLATRVHLVRVGSCGRMG